MIPPDVDNDHIVFAIETSCNLWQTLAFYLKAKGYRVLLVSPLSTKHTRPVMNHDFSKTDPKDALIIANNARDGYFDYYREFTSQINAMHRLSITYCKLNKNLTQNKQRLRSLVEQIFPEFITVLPPDTKTAIYLFKTYMTPQDFLNIDICKEANQIKRISRHNHGIKTLLRLKEQVKHTIGIHLKDEEIIKTKGISEKLAALFIAETRDLDLYGHHKKIEKFAGYNLRQAQSGNYLGP